MLDSVDIVLARAKSGIQQSILPPEIVAIINWLYTVDYIYTIILKKCRAKYERTQLFWRNFGDAGFTKVMKKIYTLDLKDAEFGAYLNHLQFCYPKEYVEASKNAEVVFTTARVLSLIRQFGPREGLVHFTNGEVECQCVVCSI